MTSLALVATDLDHTFLGADQRPSELNTRSMFAAAEHGTAVIFATAIEAGEAAPDSGSGAFRGHLALAEVIDRFGAAPAA